MASRFFNRSRSRTRAPSSTRPSRSSTDRTATYYLETVPQHARDAFQYHDARRYYSRPPPRHVLTIIRDLAEFAYAPEPARQNADLLADSIFDSLGHIDTACLFTWCRHMTFEDALRIPVGNRCHLISVRLRDTWDLNIPGNDLELRFSDLWGDALQLDMPHCRTISQTLDVWRPRWQEFQITELYTVPLPRCPRHPFILKLTRHRRIPGAILP